MPMLSAQNIHDDHISFANARIIGTDTFCFEDRRTNVQAGDVLLTIVGSIGRSAVVSSELPLLTLQRSVAVMTPAAVIPRYLSYQLRSPSAQRYFSDNARGTAQKGIYLNTLAETPIVVAPAAEQARIVSKIDELFSRIEEGERALERMQKLVERYRQSALKAAVTGELTREWREKHKDELESGEALLARILAARRKAWETSELEKMNSKGRMPANDDWKKKYREPSPPDTSDLPHLPEGWVWASMDQIALVSGGLTKNQKRGELELQRPYLRVANVYANRLDLAEVYQIGVSESELDRVLLQNGDVLVVEGNGSIDQIGRVALWNGSIEGCVHQNHLIKVRCTNALISWCVLVWCMSPQGRQHIRRVASSTAGLHTLSISKVQALPVPVPSIAEMAIIRDCFGQMDSHMANQRHVIRNEVTKAASLRQSILRSAFTGALVHQDPTDEPASVLIERTAAERSAASIPAKRGRKNKQPA